MKVRSSWCFPTTTFHVYVWQGHHFYLAKSKRHSHAPHLLEHAGCFGLVERTVWETAELPSVARAVRTPVDVSALWLGSFAWGAPAAVTALLCHLARTCRLHSWGNLGTSHLQWRVQVLLPWAWEDCAVVGLMSLLLSSAGVLCRVISADFEAQSTMLHSTLLMPSAPHVGCSQSRGSIRAYIVWSSPKCADPPTPEFAALWV